MPAKKEKTTSVAEAEKREMPQRLYRSEVNRVLGGVAGGIGEYTNIDPTLVRVIFVLLTVFGGSGALLYFVLWLVLPTESRVENADFIKENIDEMKSRAKSFSASMRTDGSNPRRSGWAVFLIILGIIFIVNNYGFFHVNLEKLWPIILIVLGVLILRRR